MPPVKKSEQLPGNPANRVFIGMDPGKSGGIAFIYHDNEVRLVPMPDTRRDLWDVMSTMTFGLLCRGTVEEVSGHIGKAQPGSAMFKFGMSYERCLMCLCALDVEAEQVRPQVWQKAMGISPRRKQERKRNKTDVLNETKSGGETPTQFKNRLKAKAQELFPKVQVNLSTCDALLLAEYGRRKFEGRL